MNQRERILAVAIGAIVVCMVLYYGVSYVSSTLEARQDMVVQLESDLQKQQNVILKGKKQAARLQRYQEQSLPEDVNVASRVYRDWWLQLLDDSRIDDISVQALPRMRTQSDVFKMSSFTVVGKGDIRQVTKMLHGFYSGDYLHRIRSLRLRPLPDSDDLSISMTIDALSVKGAGNTETMAKRDSNVLNLGELDKYEDAIVNRNFFAPGNNAPKFASVREKKIHRGERESISVRADPRDKGQRVQYQLVSHNLPGDAPEVSSSSGTIRLRVEENGEYEIVVLATDSGLPAKTDQITIPISVVDPPPPEPERPRPPSFDDAKFAYVTTLMEVNGTPQLWLSLRTTGETLRLKVGDQFEVGEVEGVVSRIDFDLREVEMEWDGQLHRIRRGQSLGQAQPVED